MNIYTINDGYYSFKYYLPVESGWIINYMQTFNCLLLHKEWFPYEFKVFSGRTKSEKMRRENFNISHYHPRLLLVDKNKNQH